MRMRMRVGVGVGVGVQARSRGHMSRFASMQHPTRPIRIIGITTSEAGLCRANLTIADV